MKKSTTTLTALTAIATLAPAIASATIVSFDDNPLVPNSFYDGNFTPIDSINTTLPFTSGGVTFDYNYGAVFNEGVFSYDYWGNFTYSNTTDTSTAGYGNQYSAITGDGNGTGQDNYGIAFGAGSYINFDTQMQVSSADITNTTYAYLSMLNGDAFAKQFEAGDFFRLTINGLDDVGAIQSSTVFSLAEGTNILNTWATVDLSILGTVHGLSFEYSSSDVGSFGINTPQYFAIDNINVQTVPVPAAAYLFLSALTILGVIRKKQGI